MMIENLIYCSLDSRTAEGPFSPDSTSKVITSPSFRKRRPASLTALAWTKTSFSLSSRSMNPYPFLPLNHFTRPVNLVIFTLLFLVTLLYSAKYF